MARDLKISDRDEIQLWDRISQSVIILYYKTQTTEDRIKYSSAIVNVTTSGDSDKVVQAQIEWGKKILSAFSKGSFAYGGELISWDEKDTREKYEQAKLDHEKKLTEWHKLPAKEKDKTPEPIFNAVVYYPNWKDIIADVAGDLLASLVNNILGETNYVIKGNAVPFVKNSAL